MLLWSLYHRFHCLITSALSMPDILETAIISKALVKCQENILFVVCVCVDNVTRWSIFRF